MAVSYHIDHPYRLTKQRFANATDIFRKHLRDKKFALNSEDRKSLNDGLSGARARYHHYWKTAPSPKAVAARIKKIDDMASALRDGLTPQKSKARNTAQAAIKSVIKVATALDPSTGGDIVRRLITDLDRFELSAAQALAETAKHSGARRSKIRHIDLLQSEVDNILTRHGISASYTTDAEDYLRKSVAVSIAVDLADLCLPKKMRPATWNSAFNRKAGTQKMLKAKRAGRGVKAD